MSDTDMVGKIVVAKSLAGTVHGVGQVVAYTDQPTVMIKDRYGHRFSWVASLCRIVELSEEEAKCLFPIDTEGPK